MLFINDDRIDFQEVIEYKGTDPLKIFLKEKIAEIKAGPQHLRFKFRDGVIRLNKLQGLPEGKKVILSWEDPVVSNRGSELWVYATGRSKKPNGVYKYVSPSVIFVKELWLDKDRDLDRVLFMLHASSRVRTGLIVLENAEVEAKTRLTKSIDKDELKVFILRMEQEKLQKLGSAFQIENARSFGEFALREAILGKADLMVSEGRSSYADVLTMVKSEELSSMRANVQLAKDMGILSFQNGVFGFANEKGNVVVPIIQVPTKREFEKDAVLIAFLEQNNSVYTKLVQDVKSVQQEGEEIEAPKISAKGKSSVLVEDTDEEKDAIIDGITSYVITNRKLPFESTDKDKIKQVIKLLGIPGYSVGTRPYAAVYEDVKKHFGVE